MRVIMMASLLLVAGLLVTGCTSDSGGTSASATPGGTSGRDVLAKHSALTAKGQVPFPRAAVTDTAVQQAYCTYLFGSVAQVRTLAGLPKKATLDPRSGFTDLGGANGHGFECTYDTALTKPVFVIEVTTTHSNRSTAKGTVIVNLSATRQAALAYAPDFTGTVISKAKAQVWLRAAGKRVSP